MALKYMPKLTINVPSAVAPSKEATPTQKSDLFFDAQGNRIQPDASQQAALNLITAEQAACLVGNAGTGKTTLVQAYCAHVLKHDDWWQTQYRIAGEGTMVEAPSIAIVAYTNKATRNIASRIRQHPALQSFHYNITTVHNLLEYTVEFVFDPETGKTKRHYYPKRTAQNPLNISHLIIEEATLLGAGPNTLWQQVLDALPPHCKILFLGDINQLPPVIGKSVLSYALMRLPTAELTTIHRQALDNPIIAQAHRVLKGLPPITQLTEADQGVQVLHGKSNTRIPTQSYNKRVSSLILRMIENGDHNPDEDMILIPVAKPTERMPNAAFFNAAIATHLAQRANAKVYTINTGFNQIYLREGERVRYESGEYKVISISTNDTYTGKIPPAPSTKQNYWGTGVEDEEDWDFESLDLDAIINSKDKDDEEGAKRAASHIVTLQSLEDPNVHVTLSSAGDFNEQKFSLGYCTTVHKAQGSEWPRVIILLHHSQTTMLYNELLYTAITRARHKTTIIAQEATLKRAAKNKRIKGNSLAAKKEYFTSGYLSEDVALLPADLTT